MDDEGARRGASSFGRGARERNGETENLKGTKSDGSKPAGTRRPRRGGSRRDERTTPRNPPALAPSPFLRQPAPRPPCVSPFRLTPNHSPFTNRPSASPSSQAASWPGSSTAAFADCERVIRLGAPESSRQVRVSEEGFGEREKEEEAELERATLARVDEVGGCRVRSLMRGESCLLGGGGGGG